MSHNMKNTQKANKIRNEIVKMQIKAKLENKPVDYNVLSAKYNELKKLGHAGAVAFNCKNLNVGV